MSKLRYPSVPSPSNNPESIFRTVSALYQGYNALTGTPNTSDLTVVSEGNFPVTPDPILKLDDLEDVTIDTAEENHVLLFDAADQLWKNQPVQLNMALMYHTEPAQTYDPYTGAGTGEAITDYENAVYSTETFVADEVTGIIEVLQDGLYTLTAWVHMEQPGVQQNLEYHLEMDVIGVGRTLIDSMIVASAQTDNRVLQATFSRFAPANTEFRLWVSSTATMGPLDCINLSFEIRRLVVIDAAISASIPPYPP